MFVSSNFFPLLLLILVFYGGVHRHSSRKKCSNIEDPVCEQPLFWLIPRVVQLHKRKTKNNISVKLWKNESWVCGKSLVSTSHSGSLPGLTDFVVGCRHDPLGLLYGIRVKNACPNFRRKYERVSHLPAVADAQLRTACHQPLRTLVFHCVSNQSRSLYRLCAGVCLLCRGQERELGRRYLGLSLRRQGKCERGRGEVNQAQLSSNE